MITREEALDLARPWALASLPASGGEVNLWEFDLGYVASPKIPPTDPAAPPTVLGAPRLVIDKESGETAQYPSLPAPVVAQRYQAAVAARHRFPAEVRDVLHGAGWQPGRDVSARVRVWLDEVYESTPDARELLPLFPAAAAALAEFGALRFTQLTRVGYAGGGFRVEVWPDVGRVVVDLLAEFAADLGVPVFPFAWYEDGPSDAVIAADGRVFLLHPVGEFLVADNLDAAITALVTGPQLRPVDDHGSPLER